ncbi:MAG: aminotransferase class I/II-fold pyridoxal phosphate-dependent enzyme [Candidatus Helarchaeota archaeon]
MHPIAKELNTLILQGNKYLYEMLSPLGKQLYFPKGILSQSAEAKQKAHKYNATIGIATEGNLPMYLPCLYKYFNEIPPRELFLYAPASGILHLREKWREKMLSENPALQNKQISLPIVTNGLTHGLSIIADLFAAPQDTLILPDKFWGNYRLLFGVRKEVKIVHFPFFNSSDSFNIEGFQSVLDNSKSAGKLIVLLNFPNNPTGYSITKKEMPALVKTLQEIAETGCNLVIVLDDAYFGLFYGEDTLKESLFGFLANLHERILSIKIDGATKEEFVWGFRLGFITFGAANTSKTVYNALERKVMGAIRGNISNCPHPSQSIIFRTLESPTFRKEQQEKFDLLKQRALEVRRVLSNPKFTEAWDVYPFNSGYFMCLRLKSVNAETFRQYLLEHYGVGVIAINSTDVRIAFSCIEREQINELFEIMFKAINELQT